MKKPYGNIEIRKTAEKRCKGYYDLVKKEIVPCRTYTDMTSSQYCQCRECQTKSGFDLCLGCNGSICRTNSDAARKFCNEEHYVYLAYFANDKFKVGTAAGYRKYERLLEQGALYSIFLAQAPNGRIARQIESSISDLGIVSRVNSTYKMNNFVIDREQEEIDRMLLKEYEYILNQIDATSKKFLIRPQYNNFTNISEKVRQSLIEESIQLDLFGGFGEPEHKAYEKIAKPEIVFGEIKAVVGSLMLMQNNGIYSVVNMKNLEGWLVDFRRKEMGEKVDGSFNKSDR